MLKWTTEWFQKQGLAAPRRQGEELLGHVLDLERLDLYLQFDYQPTPSERELFKKMIQRRAKGEPLQYIKGYQKFCGLKIKTDSRALIPRVETEILVQKLVDRLREFSRPQVIDLGTGSACLALALAKKGAQIWASDISPEALSLAQENAAALGLEGSIRFAQGDLFAAFEKQGPTRGWADLVVSNPPYIGEDERSAVEAQVASFEPASALFSGADGGDTLRRLMQDSSVWLKPGGFVAFEISPRHVEMLTVMADQGPWENCQIEKDDQDLDRYFFAKLKNNAIG